MDKINKNKFGIIECYVNDKEELNDIKFEDTDNTVYATDKKGNVYLYSKKIKGWVIIKDVSIDEQLKTMEKQIKDILVRLGLLESNTPREQIYNLPVVNLNGDLTGISADNKVTLTTELLDVYGVPIYTDKKCTLKWQGSSSLGYPKKNYTYTLFENDGVTKFKPLMFDDVPNENKYHLKANYIDYTHARNIVVANLTKESYVKNLPSNARGCIDGFPVLVFINGEKQGIYTFNLRQTDKVYGLDESNPNHLMYRAEWNFPDHACGFRKLSENNADWEEKFPETNLEENRTKLNRLIAFVKDSDDDSFKNNFSQYMDLDYAIDYWLWCYFLGLTDSLARNLNLVTYDGLIWYPTFYDMDNCFGYGFSGLQPSTVKCPEEYQCTDSLLWEKLARVFKSEIKARYNTLRNGKMTKSYVYNKMKTFMDSIHFSEYAYDQTKWTGIMGKEQDLKAIGEWLIGRETYCDSMFNADENINVESVSIDKEVETLNIINTASGDYLCTFKIKLDGTQTLTEQGGTGGENIAFEYDIGQSLGEPSIYTICDDKNIFETVSTKAECLASSYKVFLTMFSGTARLIFSVPTTICSSVETANAYLSENNITFYFNKGNILDLNSYEIGVPIEGSTEWKTGFDYSYRTLIDVTEGEKIKIVSRGSWCGLYTFDEAGNYIALISNAQTSEQIVTIPAGVSKIALKCGTGGNADSKYNNALYRLDSNENIVYPLGGSTIATSYESKNLVATLTPTTATNKNVTWSVDNSNISINPNGLRCEITAVNEGSSIVTVTTEDGNKTATCNITVNTIND